MTTQASGRQQARSVNHFSANITYAGREKLQKPYSLICFYRNIQRNELAIKFSFPVSASSFTLVLFVTAQPKILAFTQKQITIN